MKRTAWMVARVAVAVALLWWLTTAGGLEWVALGGLLDAWTLTLAAFAMILTATVMASWRFKVLLAARDLTITLGASVRLTLIGTFFNTVLPGAGGGDLVRFYYGVRGHEGRRAEILSVMLFDRICGMAAMIAWPLLAAPFFLSLWWDNSVLRALLAAGLVVGAGMAVTFVLSWTPLARDGGPLSRIVQRLPAGAALWNMVSTIASYRGALGHLALALAISLLGHTLGISAAVLIAAATNPEGFALAMSMLIPLGMMANAIPLTPGGLGVGEAAFDSLFGLAGFNGGAEVLLGWRVLILGVGLLGLGVYLSERRDFVRVPDDD